MWLFLNVLYVSV